MKVHGLILTQRCAFTLVFAALAGCGAPTPKPQPQAKVSEPRETWDTLYMQGQRLGYVHQIERPKTVDTKQVVEVQSESHFGVQRYGEEAKPGMAVTAMETPDDRLISFTFESRLSASPMTVTGRVEDGKLTIETEIGGDTRRRTIEWPDEARGLLAVEHSLLHRPMQPGEQREIRHLEPTTQSLVVERLEAKEYEQTELLSGTQKLLRIESAIEFPGQKTTLRGTLWTDDKGETLKTALPGGETIVYRATEQEATATDARPAFDLGRATLVKLAKPLEDARSTERIRYRVELKTGDPATVFATGGTQEVITIGPHAAEITVRSLDPVEPSCTATSEADEGDRNPNSRIQSDDPKIVAMAGEAADSGTPAEIAMALEKYVYDKMLFKRNYSIAFATASEVAKSLEGDCSERSVLLAALARARGIPARVAMGLVYSPNDQAFAYHMWTEVLLSGCWVPLDATLGQGRVSADHIKLADSNLADETWLAGFAPVAEVIGQLRIDVLEAE
jgi:transglutaminase-like putative cysteine protease